MFIFIFTQIECWSFAFTLIEFFWTLCVVIKIKILKAYLL
jgi:hypothetical protein